MTYEDELCLEPNAAEHSWMADRFFCSLKKGHNPELDPHIAYYNHKPQFGVRWWGPWQDGTDWKIDGAEANETQKRHGWLINPENPRGAGVSPNLFADTPNNAVLAMQDITERHGVIKAQRGRKDDESRAFLYWVEIFDYQGNRWAFGGSNENLDRAIRYALGYFYNHLPEGW